MPQIEAIRSLRLSQGIFSVVNLALASYSKSISLAYLILWFVTRNVGIVVHELVQTTQQHVTSDVAISLVAACVSVVSVLCAPGAANLSKKCMYKPSLPR